METIGQGAADLVRFGTFEVNLRTGELRKRGIRIALQEQPLRVLAALLERAGEVVGREDLCRRLWPHGTFVDFEHSLNAAVRPFGLNYSRFIDGLSKSGLQVDRKVLSDLAIHEPAAFQAIVEKAKAALPAAA